MIYVTANTNFFDPNIIAQRNLPFKTVEQMNETIIYNWNKAVDKNDTVLHMGNFARCSASSIDSLIKKLHGNIILFPGLLDDKSILEKCSVILLPEEIHMDTYDKTIIFSHHPMLEHLNSEIYISIHGHHYTEYTFYKNFINVSMDYWNFLPIPLPEILTFYKKNKGKTL